MRLSIIVPMYKVGPYVERCIRSLEDQDLPREDYEIICVNDGSPDNCRNIVEGLQMEFDNIVLINQKNQGVSMARNNAIAIAEGNYILPIDPDDYVVPNCLRPALEQAEQDQLDVLYTAFEIFDIDHKSIWRTNYAALNNRIDQGDEGYFTVRGPTVNDPDRSWAIFYRRDMLSEYHIQYPKDVPYLEDGLFLGKVFAVAKRVGYSNQDFYQRTTRPGSATNSRLIYSDEALRGFILAANDIKTFKATYSLMLEQSDFINHLIAKFVFLPLMATLGDKNLVKFMQVTAKLRKSGFKNITEEGCRSIYLDYVKWYNRHAFLFACYFLMGTKLRRL